MPLKPHPTDPDKMVYASRQYDIPQLQGVTTTQRPWVSLTDEERASFDATNPKTQEEWDALFNGIEDKLKEKNT